MQPDAKSIGNSQSKIAYVRHVDVADLPEEMRDQAPTTGDIYAIHSEDGERLAVVSGRHLAFSLARRNDLWPVSVH